MAAPVMKAKALALAIPAAAMLGALGSQYLGGLHPCEMCYWQRWPHEAAIVLAFFAFAVRNEAIGRALTWLAAVAILISGLIGVFHAGVEYGWWQGLTTCSTTGGAGGVSLDDIMNTPVIRCDVPQWTLAGISLAGFNALFSIGGAFLIARLLSDAHENCP